MKKSEIQKILIEIETIERGGIAPARVRQVTLLPDGTILRVELNPETYCLEQALVHKDR